MSAEANDGVQYGWSDTLGAARRRGSIRELEPAEQHDEFAGLTRGTAYRAAQIPVITAPQAYAPITAAPTVPILPLRPGRDHLSPAARSRADRVQVQTAR